MVMMTTQAIARADVLFECLGELARVRLTRNNGVRGMFYGCASGFNADYVRLVCQPWAGKFWQGGGDLRWLVASGRMVSKLLQLRHLDEEGAGCTSATEEWNEL